MKRFSLMSLICYLAFYSLSGVAGITVNKMILTYSPTDTFKDIKVTNSGHSMQYVYVKVQKITLKNNKEKDVDIQNPKEMGLLATPSKLILQPNQSQYVRVLRTQPAGDVQEGYYVTATPVVGSFVMPKTKGKSKKAYMKMILGYSVRVVLNPKTIHADVQLTRQGKKVTAVNNGNVAMVLEKGQQCESAKKCTSLKSTVVLLYPSQTSTFSVPKAQPVKFHARYIGTNTDVLDNLTTK